jgi:hypothetical protein
MRAIMARKIMASWLAGRHLWSRVVRRCLLIQAKVRSAIQRRQFLEGVRVALGDEGTALRAGAVPGRAVSLIKTGSFAAAAVDRGGEFWVTREGVLG